MPATNHTPLDDDTIKQLTSAEEVTAEEKKHPITVSVSPESAPIQVEITKKVDQNAPESTATDENKEEAPTNEHSQPSQPYIEERPEEIELPPELKKLGLKAIQKDDFPDYQNVKLPISDEKVMMGAKAPPNSSLRWLAEFAKLLLWRAHITLKTVHGRVVRIIKRKS